MNRFFGAFLPVLLAVACSSNMDLPEAPAARASRQEQESKASGRVECESGVCAAAPAAESRGPTLADCVRALNPEARFVESALAVLDDYVLISGSHRGAPGLFAINEAETWFYEFQQSEAIAGTWRHHLLILEKPAGGTVEVSYDELAPYKQRGYFGIRRRVVVNPSDSLDMTMFPAYQAVRRPVFPPHFQIAEAVVSNYIGDWARDYRLERMDGNLAEVRKSCEPLDRAKALSKLSQRDLLAANSTGEFQLRVMTFNIAGIPFADHDRYAVIGGLLKTWREQGRAPHVVLIQEGFDTRVQELVDSAGYPYVKKGPSGAGLKRSSGLLI